MKTPLEISVEDLQVGLVFGGPSGEHDVSLESAKNIAQAIQGLSCGLSLLGITRNGQWRQIPFADLQKTSMKEPIDLARLGVPAESWEKDIDVAFPICHGPFGEDGTLQQLFVDAGIPYVGSEPESCRDCLDKALTKAKISTSDLLQAPYLVTQDKSFSFAEATRVMTLPLFVKPSSMGSSVGISKVSNEEQWASALEEAFLYDSTVVVEQGLVGREVECALLETESGIQVSGTAEIVSSHDFYSYEAKYLDPKGAEFIYPAKLEPDVETALKVAAQTAFRALGCRDFVRADFFVTPENQIYFNELNTHPGFTSISQFPMLWKREGLSYEELIRGLIVRAVRR